MASSMTVVVLCPNARRQPVKITPNSSVLEVLEEACKKQGLDPKDYDVRHYNRRLDLSLSVRYASLPNNAQLELIPAEKIRRESEVTVALQLESGERIVSGFNPSSSMEEIVEKCLASRSDITAEDMQSGEPVCVYMRQQFSGEQLKKTTLRSLGLTGGKTIIRLMYRPLEALAGQAHISSKLTKPQTPIEVPTATIRKTEFSGSSENTVAKHPRIDMQDHEKSSESGDMKCEAGSSSLLSFVANSPLPNKTEPTKTTTEMQVDEKLTFSSDAPFVQPERSVPVIEDKTVDDTEEMECDSSSLSAEIGEIKFLGPRNAILFNLEDISEVKKEDFPPDFFDLTVNDVQYLFSDYKRVREELENEPLTLKSHKEARILQKLSCYKQSVIRIYFPDKLVLQGTFIAEETIQVVEDFVRDYLAQPQLDFYLYITPPKMKLSSEKTLLEARLVPAAVVYFGCNTPCENYLSDKYRTEISDPRAAWKVAAQHRQKEETGRALEECVQMVTVHDTVMNNGSDDIPVPVEEIRTVHPPVSSDTQGVKPKWFKLGNK